MDCMVERARDSLAERGLLTREEGVLTVTCDRKGPSMNEQHTEGAAPPAHDTAADKVEDVLRKRTGGTEEHPVEGHADEAQRETPGETRQNQGKQDGEQ